ncbi:fatty acyl-AMP ligase [Microbacterium sp. ET2]|uniref:fatty acyl-AMP ligase n=1 Tax=Microbacterium albipurpureum TaxID=3050384 RepID=UPI00259D0439|nr:fatty acyl-AMP ligase [Microbacterium sp. ET2 (Ac-2212)]WJL94728.1 fatty acyl-AMP ligase [Microbacterium sp. ET2 (Ac-2212)]
MTLTASNLVTALRDTAARIGDDHGLLFYDTPDESTYRGYAELDERARRIAQALQAAGHQPGETAVVALEPGLHWADAAYGILYAGMALVPAPVAGYGTTGTMGERIAGIARSAEASVVITEPSVQAAIGGPLPGVEVSSHLFDELLASGKADEWVEPALTDDSIAFLLYTSGSTGDPKGVIGTHGTLIATISACGEIFGMNETSVLVGWSPLHHVMGLMLQVLNPASLGAQAVITATAQFQRRPIFWLQLISKHRGTVSVAGNFAFALCTQLATDEQIAELDLSSVKVLFSGSEPVRPQTVNGFLERFASTGLPAESIAPVMGMTEAMLISGKFPGDGLVLRTFDKTRFEEGELVPATGPDAVEMVSCGRPSSETSVVIVDPDTFRPVPEGTVGEIWVASPMVSPGYFRRPDANAETFGHTLPGDDRSYMRTGDLAAVLDGELYITGRLKEMIIIRGRNIYPQDLEARAAKVSPALGMGSSFELEGHPSVVGIVLELDPETAPTGTGLDDLAEAVRAELMKAYSLPSVAVAFVAAGQLPRTATGKVRRRPTRAQIESGTLPVIHTTGFRPALTATA